MFQSTHPHGGRRRYLITNVFFLVFQSTHPHGVRREDATPTTMNWQSFNPRTLTGCDRKKIPGPSKQRSFNPRTLTGCDSTGHYQQCRRDVSIHAPSRGATISVHWLMYTAYCFNPRTLTGCDSSYTVQQQGSHGVSIHAPSRGATDKTNPNQKHLTVSIHAPSRGATLPSKQAIMLYGMFQSTHPHGVRRGCWSKKPIGSMFQSTHPHGVRL